MPSTSCAYQRGKVSLSPTVTNTPYGSTESRRSLAKSRVSVWPAREAACQLTNRGMKASARTGDENSQAFLVGRSAVSRAEAGFSVPIAAEKVSHRNTNPSPTQTLHAEKLQR